MWFANPLPLLLLPAMAVPVVLHLLSPRRPRIVPFAAAMLLTDQVRRKGAGKRLRRLAQMLARCLVIGCACLALAGPGCREHGVAPEQVVVLLDRSAGMRANLDGTSRFEQAGRKVAQFLESLPPGAKVTPVLFDTRCDWPAGEAVSAAMARAELAGASCSWRGTDLAGALEQVLAQSGGRKRTLVAIASDFSVTPTRSLVWPGGVEVLALPVGDRAEVHDAVIGARLSGDRMMVRATAARPGAELRVEAEGMLTVRARAGPSRRARLTLQRKAPEVLTVTCLAADPFAADDRWAIASGGPEPVRVAAAGTGPAITALVAALRAVPGACDVQRLPGPEALSDDDLERLDLIVLHAPGPIDEATGQRLAHFVQSGRALLIFAGRSFVPGTELALVLPAATTGWRDDIDVGLTPAPAHRAWTRLRDELDTSPILVRSAWQLSLAPGGRPLLTAVPGAGDALLGATTGVGDGRVALVGMTLKPADANLAATGAFVPLLHELLAHLVPAETLSATVQAGRMLRLPLRRPATGVRLTGPDGESLPVRLEDGGRVVVVEVGGPGLSTLTVEREGETSRGAIAVNVAATDRAPVPGDPEQALAGLGYEGTVATGVPGTGRASPWGGGATGTLAGVLSLLALGLLLAEQALGAGRRSRQGGEATSSS